MRFNAWFLLAELFQEGLRGVALLERYVTAVGVEVSEAVPLCCLHMRTLSHPPAPVLPV